MFTRTNAFDPIGYVFRWKVVQKKDKLVVCEIIGGRIRAICIEVYIKHKIGLLRDYNVIAAYEFLDDLDVEIDPSAWSRVVQIHIRKDPLK